jgi:uncharacterized protein YdhG (YjbR/CyaY superfamily)
MADPATVDEYLSALPDEQRDALADLRKTIAAAAPEATELISYRMPAFRASGRFLLSYAAYEHHCSLYPASEAVQRELGEELAPYLSGKGTLRFLADAPIPDELVKRIVQIRLREIEGSR